MSLSNKEKALANYPIFKPELLELVGYRVPYQNHNAHIKAHHRHLMRNKETYFLGEKLEKNERVMDACKAMQTVF